MVKTSGLGATIYEALLERGVVNEPADNVRRCIIDLSCDTIRVLVEVIGDEKLLSLGELLDGENAQEG